MPPPAAWDGFCESHNMPSAKERRDEILKRVADFYIRREGRGLFQRLFRIKPEGFYEIEDHRLTVQFY